MSELREMTAKEMVDILWRVGPGLRDRVEDTIYRLLTRAQQAEAKLAEAKARLATVEKAENERDEAKAHYELEVRLSNRLRTERDHAVSELSWIAKRPCSCEDLRREDAEAAKASGDTPASQVVCLRCIAARALCTEQRL